MILIAHDIRSLHNVGSVFRSADAFGIERVHLTGYTPAPPRPEIAKVALGSELRVAWEQGEIGEVLARLKAEGHRVLALDNVPGAEDIRGFEFRQDDALLLGNEVEGLDPKVRAACDATLAIALPGRKRSLNVSVACGVALFAATAFRR